ncbi:DUF4168 domain-containing protein [Hugenholtzia roseola]|uniref:DUF4168 domain-containing protein n=1 Tax=Hugenholtzia roseola TaxID=1002 RepID=UPI00040C3FC0|nr:DUF4168 domain-containing protein [Hugenholtzia roseola]
MQNLFPTFTLCLLLWLLGAVGQSLWAQNEPISEQELRLYAKTLKMHNPLQAEYEKEVATLIQNSPIGVELFTQILVEGEKIVPKDKQAAYQTLKVELTTLKQKLEAEKRKLATSQGLSEARYFYIKAAIAQDHNLHKQVHQFVVAQD